MIIQLGAVNKKANSTLQPGLPDSYDCNFKDGCDIVSPTVVLRSSNVNYNYAYMNGRYYYVSSCIAAPSGFLEITLECDVLASYKSNIVGSTQFVEYCTAGNNNREIPDTRFPVEPIPRYNKVTSSFLGGHYNQSGMFVVFVAGNSPAWTVGGTFPAYACTPSELSSLANYIYNVDDTIIDEWNKFVTNAKDAIVFCSWIPVDASSFSGTPGEISIGKIGTGANGIMLQSSTLTFNDTVEIPWRWEDFRNVEPWTYINIFIPGLGSFPLSAHDLNGQSTLLLRETLDVVTGALQVEILTATCKVATFNGNLGASVPVGGSSINFGGALSSAVAAVSSAGTGAGLLASATGMLNNLVPTTSISGGAGSRAVNPDSMNVEISLHTFYCSDEPNAWVPVMGKATFETRSLSGLSGYVKTRDAHVTMGGYAGEREKVENYMNSGFYIE